MFPTDLNCTNLVLIPKKENVETLGDVRPIALCNVLYKILAKVLANRLKKILPVTISENQSAFVPGRSITDNVLIAFEMIHFMRRRKSRQDGEVALKLDISKAYDRVRWSYLWYRMRIMGFSEKWIKWMKLCVTTVQYMVCLNGDSVGPIFPNRGLRQGDPLSPYLYLLCVEGLSKSMENKAANGEINGCRISQTAPAITHLLFADDSFLFFKATNEEATTIKSVLNLYENQSGQAVNFSKSGIFFSSNVRRDKQNKISEILGVYNELGSSCYLGLPSLVGRSKKTTFNFMKETVWKRVQSWRNTKLSRAGKGVMIRNVAQSIPSYCMSCFLLPKTLAQDIEKMLNGYWWKSGSSSTKGIRWLAWERMCKAKSRGGLGFRNLHGFNIALLGKHVWNFLQNPNALISRVFKERYFPNCHVLQAQKGDGNSFLWGGIWQAKEILKRGFKWVLGDGRSINIFADQWLRGKANFRVEDQPVNRTRSDKVCEYFRPNTKEWDVTRVQQAFHETDVQHILQTRIPQNNSRDRVAWMDTSTSIYTAKSGYQFWYSSNHDRRETELETGWKKLWKLQIPHKVKYFLWRLCKNNIPTRQLLRSKGV